MQDIQINNDRVNITLRESLLNFFRDKVGREMAELDCTYFAHNFIKNLRKPGYTVSSFYSNPDWQKEYWEKYWNADPLADKVCQVAEADGFAISSWDFEGSDNEAMKRRKSVCDLFDGVQFTFKHEDGVLENYSFGWKKSGKGKMGLGRLLKLSEMAEDFRNAHLRIFAGSTSHSSGGTQ